MKEIVFLASDASFKDDRSAILGVKDYFDEKHYQKIVNETGNSMFAEEQALRFAIDIAITKEYRHVVFIYDCQSVNSEKFIKRYQKNFLTMQLLWLPRDHISSVDKITKRHFSDSEMVIMNKSNEARDDIVFEAFTSIALTDREAKIMNILRNENLVGEVISERTIILSTLYVLISNNGKKRLKRLLVEHLDPKDLHRVFKRKTRHDYIAAINFYKVPFKEQLIDLMKINKIG